MHRSVLFSILAAMAWPLHAFETPKPASPAAAGQGIVISRDTTAPASKVSAKDSLATRGKAIQDSLAAHTHAVRDSLELRRKFLKDSLAIRGKAMRDSADARNRFLMDSTLAHRKAARDSALARRKFARDSTANRRKAKQDSLAAQRAARMDSLKTAAAAAAAAKRANDSAFAARKAAKRDSLKAARALAIAAKRANDSTVAAQRAARADSIKGIGDRPSPFPPKDDSVLARTYRLSDRPVNRDQIKYFQAQFGLKDPLKPESSYVLIRYRDKSGAAVTYNPRASEITYSNDGIAMLGEKDMLQDSLIHIRTDAILKTLLKDKADRYVFANYEITMMQKKDPGSENGKVYPPVAAFYGGRYLRKMGNRLILGDAFQIRIAYGAGGAASEFSVRDPEVEEGESVKVPSSARVLDSAWRWVKSRTRPRRLIYPYSPDNLLIRDLQPIKAIETYVLSEKKFRDKPQLNGSYLIPTVTVFARAVLIPSNKKFREPFPAKPPVLQFQFPCQPGIGLCWPDGGQDMLCRNMAPGRNGLPGEKHDRGYPKNGKGAKASAAAPKPAVAPAAK